VAEREFLPLLKAWRFVSLVDVPAIFVGGFGAALGHRWGAYVLLVNLVVQIGAHLVVGSVAYKETMARQWPAVAPLVDDPWDDD
jgi:hypothetical protein